MKVVTFYTLLLISLLCINTSFGYAFNYGFLDDTAGVYFDDKDWALFQKSQLYSLNHDRDGYKRTWKNADSGSWGSFMPVRTFVKNGMRCRNLTIVNAANFRVGRSTLTFCKVNGDWKGV